MILATLIDTEALGKVILFSLVAGVGVTTVFSVAIVGLARYDEGRRRGRARAGYAILAGVCALIVVAAVAEAIIVMTSK